MKKKQFDRRCPCHCRPDIIKKSMMITMQHVQMGIYSMHTYIHTHIHTYIHHHHTSTGGIIPPHPMGGVGTRDTEPYIYILGLDNDHIFTQNTSLPYWIMAIIGNIYTLPYILWNILGLKCFGD